MRNLLIALSVVALAVVVVDPAGSRGMASNPLLIDTIVLGLLIVCVVWVGLAFRIATKRNWGHETDDSEIED